MGFWLFVLIVSTVFLSYKIYNLRREYEKTIAWLKEEVFDLNRRVKLLSKAGEQPAVETRKEEPDVANRAPRPVIPAQPVIPPPPVIPEPSVIPVSESWPHRPPEEPGDEPAVPESYEWKSAPVFHAQPSSAQSVSFDDKGKSGSALSGDELKVPGEDLLQRWEKFKKSVDWELFTGVKLFAGLGGIALFIGAGFFVKYSIDRNLIPPALRLAISALIGILMIIASGRFDRVRYAVLRQTLGAGGIGMLYSVVFAATLYYQYLPKPAGFGLLSLVSASAFVLSVYYRGIAVSVLGALGAYLTPVLVSTGEGTLTMLLLYLSVVNLGVYQVIKRLDSSGLLLLATAGTLSTLFLGSFAAPADPAAIEIAGVWIANLMLFTVFLALTGQRSGVNQFLSWSGSILFLSAPIASVLLLERAGVAPFLIVTAGITGAVGLAFRDRAWFSRVIPYGAMTFVVACLWAWMRFDPTTLSWSFAIVLLYGAIGGLGPVVLIRKYGLEQVSLSWFRIFPAALGAMVLSVVVKTPVISLWLWPLIFVLQLMGLLISLLFGAVLQAGLLVVFFIICGLAWLFRMPPDFGGLGFFGFLLFAGAATSIAVVYALRKLPEWQDRLVGTGSDRIRLNLTPQSSEWLSVFPAAGAFILLAVSFLLQRPLEPHPGMFTLVLFLALSLFLSRRLSSESLSIAVLLSSLFSQGVWIFRPDLDQYLFFAAITWSGALFGAAILAPFLFFKSFEKWPRVWMGWALYEVVQGLFVVWAADHLWPRELSGWSPLILAGMKLPFVAVLASRLNGLPQRNSILAFHGGVLLFYVSAVPVMLLDQGWLGLTFVLEAALLLWLNRRVVHDGLRWVSAAMAPLGLMLLFFALPKMKAPDDAIILNSAVLSVAAAVAALGATVRLSPFPNRKLGNNDLPEYFRWLAVGSGFFLLNLAIADIFAERPAVFRVIPGPDAVQAIWYGLAWLVFGSFLWTRQKLSMTLRNAGLAMLCTGAAGIILLPLLFPRFVPSMAPIWNLGLPVYLAVLVILLILILREARENVSRQLYNLLMTLFLVTGFMAVKVEISTFVQSGMPFQLFHKHTSSMAAGSAAGWLAYGLGLLLWPRGLDRPFRIAGVVLVLAGLIKALLFPFTHPAGFGAMTPLLNYPTLLYVFALGMLLCLTLDKPKQHWPFESAARSFWGVLLAIMTFCVLNIEISSVFSESRKYFSLLTYNDLAHELAYSMGMLFYSIGLLVVGIKWNAIKVRWAALGFLVLTAFKIFFMDLWKLGQLYRVASFVGLAAVLILVSFLYQRFLASRDLKEEKAL